MAWRDKIKGWFCSILLKFLRGIVSVEGIILCGALGLMALVVGEFFCWRATEFFEVENAGVQPSELLIVTLGAIGAACGLILAARRSAKFSEQVEIGQKQVETGQKQLFNEQLGRAAELLTKEEKPMRRASIRILEGLAETTINQGLSKENIKQAQLIMRIIHDFVHADTSPPLKDDEDLETRIEKGKEKLDIALGIRTLVSLYNESGKPDDFKELVQFRSCRLEGLIFTDAELQGVDFIDAQLQGANFIDAQLQGAQFMYAQLQGAHFNRAQLQGVNFIGAKLERANFRGAELQGANFMGAKLERANFRGTELEWVDFTEAELERANFIGAKLQKVNFIGANLEWVDCTDADFSGAENLKKEQVGVMIFDTKFFPKLPKGVKDDLDPKRGYEWKKDSDDKSNRRYFVQPDVNAKESEKWEWSGKSVDEYLASIRGPEDDG